MIFLLFDILTRQVNIKSHKSKQKKRENEEVAALHVVLNIQMHC